MIGRLFQREKRLTKSQRKVFVPFVNERNFMGSLIRSQEMNETQKAVANEQLNSKDIALIQSLKKSTKEYFFDKNFQKMTKKLHRIEESLNKHEVDYDLIVTQCFQMLNFNKTFHPSPQTQNYYVDLKQSLNQKILYMKNQILQKIGRQKTLKQKGKTVNLQEQFEQNISSRRKLRDQRINREIFKEVGNKSQFMSDFSNQGLKYRHLVQSKKINPWKKWYVKQNIEIFPGEAVTLKKLQKTIY